jgi:GT2 family glycosyltransferase
VAELLVRLRYRSADLRRLNSRESAADGGGGDQAVRWVTATAAGQRGRPSLQCPSRSRVSYDVILPPRSRIAAWCTALPDDVGKDAVKINFEITVEVSGAAWRARRCVDTAAGTHWRALHVDVPRSGPARIVLSTGTDAPTATAALWGEPRIEFRRSLAELLSLVREMLRRASVRALWYRALPPNPDRLYRLWVRDHEPSRGDLRRQRQWSVHHRTRFTVITFIDRACSESTLVCADALSPQSYPHWEWLAVVSGSVPARLTRFARSESRVRILPVPSDASRAEAWNTALRASTGEFAALVDAGDGLTPDALYSIARALEQHKAADVFYADEDRRDRHGNRRDPRFKPDWSPDLLLAVNYIGRLAAFRVATVLGIGGFRSDHAPHEEWDVWLRLSLKGDAFHRLPQCLYHRAGAQVDVDFSAIGGLLAAHCQTLGLREPSVAPDPSGARVTWRIDGDPLVTIVIPNRDAGFVLERCVRGIQGATDYRPIDLVIVDNRSTEQHALDLYERLTRERAARVVSFDRPFNFSAACNAGAAAARGELLLFLNNDVEVLHPDWLLELVRWARRPEVGVVGATLLYPDRRIQHAGVVLGIGLAGHIFAGGVERTAGIFGASDTYRNYLAVTGACQMMRRDVFQKAGRFDERFRLTFSDVVLCMEARKAGYRVVYTPYARLIHHESYTREGEDPSEDMQLLARYLRANAFEEDPFFHPELNPASTVPALRPPWARSPSDVVHESVNRIVSLPRVAGEEGR